MHAHLARYVAQYYVAVFQLDAKSRIGEVFQDLSLHLYDVVLCHLAYRIGRLEPLKFAFLSSESYWWDIM